MPGRDHCQCAGAGPRPVFGCERQDSRCVSEGAVSSPSASPSCRGQPNAPGGTVVRRGQRAPASRSKPKAVPRLKSTDCAPLCGQAPAWITQMPRVSGNVATYAIPGAAGIGTPTSQFRPSSRRTSMHARSSGSSPGKSAWNHDTEPSPKARCSPGVGV